MRASGEVSEKADGRGGNRLSGDAYSESGGGTGIVATRLSKSEVKKRKSQNMHTAVRLYGRRRMDRQ